MTSRWLAGPHQAENDDLEAMGRFGAEDMADVLAANVLIAFTEEPRQPSANRGGQHVEMGIALDPVAPGRTRPNCVKSHHLSLADWTARGACGLRPCRRIQ